MGTRSRFSEHVFLNQEWLKIELIQMSLVAAALMFWPLLYYGVKHGDLTRKEGIALAIIWTGWLVFTTVRHLSPWYYFVPSLLITVYLIWIVLGPDVEGPKGCGTL